MGACQAIEICGIIQPMSSKKKPGNDHKELSAIAGFLLFLFIITVASHMIFVKGLDPSGGHEKPAYDKGVVTLFSTEEECKKAGHQKCKLQLCDNIPAG